MFDVEITLAVIVETYDILSINDTSTEGMNVSRNIFSQLEIIQCIC